MSEETKDAAKILKKRYVGDDPKRRQSLEDERTIQELLCVIREIRKNLVEINYYCHSSMNVEEYAAESIVKADRVLKKFGGDE